MSVRLIIDALDFARNAAVRHGKIAISEFERLQDYLVDNPGELQYAVTGGWDTHQRPVLRIAVEGFISLRCQRCLEKFEHVLDVHAELLLAKNEHELARFDEDETVDCVLAEPEMDLLVLIEDEIILGLPISPRHEQLECRFGERGGDEATREKSPFAVLAALKKTH